MSKKQFRMILAIEAFDRLKWFARLRWLAVVGLAASSLIGPRLGFDLVWPSLFVVAGCVAGYNSVFVALFGLIQRSGSSLVNLRAYAILQMLLDLGALLVMVHYTGGIQSPFLFFFTFHMAIGTIMIATRIMFVLASVTCLGVFGMSVLEGRGVIPFHPFTQGAVMTGEMQLLTFTVFAVSVFGIVYLTHSVASRVKQRNLELHGTTQELSERTAELQRLLDEKDEIERRKSHYMRISAHQLRSPLGTIKTSLQVLLDGFIEPGSEGGVRMLEGAAERVDDLLAIVNDLLELAKMREGRARAPWVRQVYLNQVLADIFDALEPFASSHDVELVADIDGVAMLEWGVPPDLVYAFENLIHNAIKYSDSGGKVEVRLRVREGVTQIDVVDDGIGIPDELQDEVFLEFVRAPNAKQHVREGTGLGLSIVREGIMMHGGTISLASREGEGTEFTIMLPLHYVPPEVAGQLDERAFGEAQSG